jgi:1,4-alpha-glucan branching enzyme
LQLQTGIESHRRRFGGWDGGLWLPECAYEPGLDPALERAGVRAACVELTNAFGLGSERHLTPVRSPDGPVLWPIDRSVIALAWGQGGYPSRPPYRDYHAYTTHRHRVRRIDGGPYDHDAAARQARADAAEFVAAVRERVRRGGVSVFAVDTELLGHWWYEGIDWLRAVLGECSRQGLELLPLDDALERFEPADLAQGQQVGEKGGEIVQQPITWGRAGDLSTWSGPSVAEMAFAARAAELEVERGGAEVGMAAVRELLALQASDWPFMVSREIAVPYARERFAGHQQALQRALAAGAQASDQELRNLALHADLGALTAP